MNLVIDEILRVKEPADRVHMSITSDNKFLAFCLGGEGKGHSKGVSQVVVGNSQWVFELETEKLIQVAPQANSSWAGVWSPDGSTLAFFADMDGFARLWLWYRSNKQLKLASSVVVRPFFGFEKPIWTKDGRYIIVKAMPSDGEDDNASFFYSSDEIKSNEIINPLVFSTISSQEAESDIASSSWESRYRADILMIDCDTGRATPISTGERPVGLSLSRDGQYLAFTSCRGEEKNNSQQIVFDLWVCCIDKKSSPQRIAHNIRLDYGLSFSWGYDHQTIYFTTNGPLSDGKLWVVKLSDPMNPVSLGKPNNIHLGREFDSPVPSPAGDIFIVAAGSLWRYSTECNEFFKIEMDRQIRTVLALDEVDCNLIVQTRDIKSRDDGFWRINLDSLQVEVISEEPLGHLPWFLGGAVYGNNNGASVITYFAQNADEAPAIRVLDATNKNVRIKKISHLTNTPIGKTELLTWTTGNTEVRGALLLPKNANGRIPVIMRVYGGSMQSNDLRNFGLSTVATDNHHIFASNGFAVFLPDLPMKRSHEPAEELTNVIKDALQALLQHPRIDPERVGIIGHSFGGYSALVAITKLHMFKAAVISAGIGNLISFYTDFNPFLNVNNFGWVEDGQVNIGATLWEAKDRYIRNSPLFDLDKVQTPILIVQGQRDTLCRNEAGPIYLSLKRLGKTAELAIYDEDHSQVTWKKESLTDYYNRVLAWFGKYL